MPRRRTPDDPFRWFDSSPEVIRLVVMMYTSRVADPRRLAQPGSGELRLSRDKLPLD